MNLCIICLFYIKLPSEQWMQIFETTLVPSYPFWNEASVTHRIKNNKNPTTKQCFYHSLTLTTSLYSK